ncbi:hypothetical protein BS50DRAFT_580636 [Corynespora cassiicola Philippines]|uniref:Uncharacterized protein n=1 Tax=Corynespora cassiicola Philippines TaxID=1448308 RepID=A0A2T2MZN4_CORCC|nr:hypothetical protein BS50DRAFT_580636 [Corynespora cassiicola Philippines]
MNGQSKPSDASSNESQSNHSANTSTPSASGTSTGSGGTDRSALSENTAANGAHTPVFLADAMSRNTNGSSI